MLEEEARRAREREEEGKRRAAKEAARAEREEEGRVQRGEQINVYFSVKVGGLAAFAAHLFVGPSPMVSMVCYPTAPCMF